MKKSVEILGLPIISITEGRELGVSKSLLIDAKNGAVAAITIEDDDWYRGVKLIPYEAIIAIGEDAVTITHSENILNLDEAGDYERLLVENVRVIGTKAITKGGYIQGNVTEVFVGDGGKIEQCEITSPDNAVNYVTAEQISIFGKQVTVIDIGEEKKNNLTEQPAFEPAFEAFSEEPPQEVWTPSVEEPPAESFETPHETSEALTFSLPQELQPTTELTLPPEEEPVTTEETQAQLEEVMTPEPVPDTIEKPIEPIQEEQPIQEEVPIQEEQPPQEEQLIQEEVPIQEEQPIQEEKPIQAEPPIQEEQTIQEEPVQEVVPQEETPKSEEPSEEDKKIAAMTQQAEDLKAALKKARANQQTPPPEQKPMVSQKKQVEKAVDERRRRVLLGKHATKTITAESGTIVVEAGAEVTEEVLQRARLSNKFIELSMNVQ